MNDDNYVEWLVKRKDPAYAVPVKILMIVVWIFTDPFSAADRVWSNCYDHSRCGYLFCVPEPECGV